MRLKSESGRSMVEMLGVLAVIGVLSIGGIAGYRMAMLQHKANSFVSDLWFEAVSLAEQARNGSSTLKLSRGRIADVDISVDYSPDDSDNFIISFLVGDGNSSTMSVDMCKKVFDMTQNMGRGVSVMGSYESASTKEICESDNLVVGSLFFIFSPNLESSEDLIPNIVAGGK